MTRSVNRTLLILATLAVGGSVAASAFFYTSASASASASAEPVPTTARAAMTTASAPAVVPAPVTPAAALLASSPELERLASRRELYESVDALVQASEFDKARRLLDEGQARFGDDSAPPWRDVEQSYRLMADCLERPSPQLRARAQAFVVVSEADGLKPRILSACGR